MIYLTFMVNIPKAVYSIGTIQTSGITLKPIQFISNSTQPHRSEVRQRFLNCQTVISSAEEKPIITVTTTALATIMELNEILKFVTDNPISFFSTLDGDQPKVRALQLFSADKTGLYYSIDASKDVYKQLKINPKVEVCFLDPKSKIGDMVRVTGKVEFVQDMEMKRKVIEARPFLKQMGITAESPGFLIMKVAECQAHHWSRANMMGPKKNINFG